MKARAVGIAITASAVMALATLGLVHAGNNARAGAVNSAPSTGSTTVERAVTVRHAQAARNLLASTNPVRISILCDSVGNDRGEWVEFWAKELAADRDVTVHYYTVDAPGGAYVSSAWSPKTLHFAARQSQGKGAVTFWTFGWAGGTPAIAQRHEPDIFPEQPDLILYSYGLNLAATNVRPQFEGLHTMVRRRFPDVPVVGILPHMTHTERPGQAVGRRLLAQWMLSRGIPLIDERRTLDPWRNGRTKAVFMDPVHPNWIGHVELARTISAALRTPGQLVEASREGRGELTSRSIVDGQLRLTMVLRDAAGTVVPYAVAQGKGAPDSAAGESSVDGVCTLTVPRDTTAITLSDGITLASLSLPPA